VWRVVIDLQFPVLLLQAGHSLLPSDDQTAIPSLVAADAAAVAAVEEARATIDRQRRERTLRDIESWSTAHTRPDASHGTLTLFVTGVLYDQPALAEGEEEIMCGICLSEIEAGSCVFISLA
jgi:hypothetical protein